ncbi:MAG: DUF4124 domain-containing protein [Gammaproteobacteria bacterium]|nr:DUF4124 domain-containing protein [Gammaproteobacteria bacterium]
MGLFIKLLLLALVLLLAAPFVIKGPDDQPLMTLDDIQNADGLTDWLQSIPQVGSTLQDEVTGKDTATAKGKTSVYSWKDEQGNVHYSNIAPTETASVQTIKVNPDMNVIKMDKPDDEPDVARDRYTPDQ